MTKKVLCEKNIWKKADSAIKPTPYAMCLLELERGIICPGWWNGFDWDGRRVKEDDKVLMFKSMGEK